MTLDLLKKQLEELQKKNISGAQVFQTITDLLQQNPPDPERELLEAWMMGYAFNPDCGDHQRDFVALYWKQYLDHEEFLLKSKAVNRLFILSKHNVSAHNFLKDYLGDEPNEINIKKQLRKLFDNAVD